MALSMFNSLFDSVPSDKQWAFTNVKAVPSIYTWTIEKFSSFIEKTGNFITSPTFTTEGYDKINWCIDLYPMGKDTEDSGYVSVYIRLISNFRYSHEVRARVHISLLNSYQEELTIVLSPQTIRFDENSKLTPPKSVKFYGQSKCIKVDSLLDNNQDLLPEGKLTIRCKVLVMVDLTITTGRGVMAQYKCQRRCILDDLGKLFENMTLSDVTLVAGGKEIQAHKAILAARSTVFSAMFLHDMQEQKQSRVDVTDVDHDTLTEMLSYIYTGRTPNLDKMAADLLVAADKYALDSLKVQCEEALCKTLSVETAADTLVLADLHSAALLKEHTIVFIISDRAKTVMATESWKNMITSYPHLLAEFFRAPSI